MTRIFDLHDGAFYTWRDAGVRDAVLVHLDAHHDATADPAWKAIDIGNFVGAAIRQRLVASVYWVVPDPMWQHAATRELIEDDAKELGLPMWLGPLHLLPRIDTPVLLDVDVDYLVTTHYEDGRSAAPLDVPWCTPAALAARIRDTGLISRMTTLATSVTGGFAPLGCAHFAEEIAAVLEGRSATMPEGAAAFTRALALQNAGDLDAARIAYRQACAHDRFYAHPFRSRGPYLYRRNRLGDAAAAYENALALDPGDPHARVGLAMIALRDARFEEARDQAQIALQSNAAALDGWRTLGAAAAHLGDRRGAIHAYERALLLGLRGEVGIRGPWSSNPERRVIDPRHWDDHASLAALHAADGSHAAAEAHRRMAAAGAAVLGS